jgi:hypothetical protein
MFKPMKAGLEISPNFPLGGLEDAADVQADVSANEIRSDRLDRIRQRYLEAPQPAPPALRACGLFLKELVESGSGVPRVDCRRGGFALDGLARLEQLTVVSDILFGYSLRNWLPALEPRSRVEVDAILARVQIGITFGTLTCLGNPSQLNLYWSAAKRTPGYLAECGHPRRSDVTLLWTCGPRALLSILILIAALLVFSIHLVSSDQIGECALDSRD